MAKDLRHSVDPNYKIILELTSKIKKICKEYELKIDDEEICESIREALYSYEDKEEI